MNIPFLIVIIIFLLRQYVGQRPALPGMFGSLRLQQYVGQRPALPGMFGSLRLQQYAGQRPALPGIST